MSKNDSAFSARNNTTAEAWLNAAYGLLTEYGVDAVKIMTLATKLDVTRTSFYWHFKGRAELLEALIQRWEDKNTGNLIKQIEKPAKTISEAILNLFDCWIDSELFDSQLDLAIRNWARQDEALQHRLTQADEKRISAITALFLRFGYSEAQAETRSRTIIYTQIGYFFMQISEDKTQRFAQIPNYIKLFTDCDAIKTEINNFLQLHK